MKKKIEAFLGTFTAATSQTAASFGLKNLTNSTNTSAPGPSLNQTAGRFGELGPAIAGTPEMAGILVMTLFGAGLFKADVGTDVAGVVLIPTALFLATEGLFPVPQGTIYGLLIGISAVVGFGLFRFAFR